MNLYPEHSKKTCINCETTGHLFKNCSKPINSYGILAYKKFKNYFPKKNDTEITSETKFLLVQRKDTIGYIDFIRGKYTDDNYEILIQEMTPDEKKRILTLSFDELWDLLWVNKKSRTFTCEYNGAKEKFSNIDVKTMILNSVDYWGEQEWCIPKGRRGNKETHLECAIREFIEETGYSRSNFNLRKDLPKIEELFYGSNGIPYKHTYFIAEIKIDTLPKIDRFNTLQSGEIRCLKWFTFKDCINIFRSYEVTKRTVIYKAKKLLFL